MINVTKHWARPFSVVPQPSDLLLSALYDRLDGGFCVASLISL